MATIKKAQKGASVDKKNTKDATQMKNARPPFTPKEMKTRPKGPYNLGSAKNGKSIAKKAPCMSCGGKTSKK